MPDAQHALQHELSVAVERCAALAHMHLVAPVAPEACALCPIGVIRDDGLWTDESL